MIYITQQRAMCLLSVVQISLEDLFFFQLLPVPTTIFTVTGEGCFRKNKATLNNKLRLKYRKESSS